MQIGIGISLTGGGQRPFSIPGLITGNNGFYFDFMTGATGAGIASVTSQPPSTRTAIQGTGSKQPVWTDSGSADYALFDGVDDGLVSDLVPGASITLGFCGRIGGVSQFMIGSTTSGANRGGAVGLNSAGKLAGAWGAHSTLVITGGSAINSTTDFVGILRCSATRVELSLNGVSLYDAAADISTPPNTTVAYAVGALSADGTLSNFVAGRLHRAFAVQTFIADAQVLPLARALGAGVVSI